MINTQQGEYSYTDAGPNPSHQYLLPIVQRFLRSLPDGARIVDLGCGNGALTNVVVSGRNWTVCGVDASHSGIAAASSAYPRLTFRVGDVTQPLPFEKADHGSFDAAISVEVVEHLLLPRGLFRNAFELLKPDGRFLVTTPYHGYLKNLVLAVSGKLDDHFTVLWDYGHVKFWSRSKISIALDEAGFDIEEFHGVGRLPFLWKSMAIVACRRPEVRPQHQE